jgi:hypothetical protein
MRYAPKAWGELAWPGGEVIQTGSGAADGAGSNQPDLPLEGRNKDPKSCRSSVSE